MELPESLFVKSVPGSDDIIAFTFPFALEGKAVEGGATSVVEALEDGDLIIEGWAAEFDGVDRQNENFIPGAFQRGIKAFLDGSATLCYHHKHDHVLGKVLALEEVEGKGLKMRARVDGAIKDSPALAAIYSQIKRGTFKNLSVGGFFKRVMTPAGYRIGDCDFTEISVTGVPVHTKPAFAVVAGKALTTGAPATPVDTGDHDFSHLSDRLAALTDTLDRLEGKAVKGEPGDLRFLAMLLQLEQVTNTIATENEANEMYGTAGEPKGNEAVDALAKRVKNYMDGIAREVHALAAELGPLPQVG